jgi:hypothetical protein
MRLISTIALASVAALLATATTAQQPAKGPRQGPLITQCKDDILKFCAGKRHDGEVRACLEAKKTDDGGLQNSARYDRQLPGPEATG